MNIWNKVLLGLTLVASLVFFWLGARSLKVHQAWGAMAVRLEGKLEAAKTQERLLLDGNESAMGLREARLQMHAMMIDRGRVWRNFAPQSVEATPNGAVSVSARTNQPQPHRIPVKAVLYVFEDKPIQEGGRYLGEFTVAAVGESDVQLTPTMKLDQRELDQLQKSQGRWSLYEVMPVDQHELLADLSEDEIKKMFPADTVDEYLADRRAVLAQSAEAAQPPRQLRDYEILFHQQHKLRSRATDEMAAAERDLQYMESALAAGDQQGQSLQNQITQLEQEKTAATKVRDAVAAHLDAVQTKLAEVEAGIRSLIAGNRVLSGAIARIQLEAARQIDQETMSVAAAQ